MNWNLRLKLPLAVLLILGLMIISCKTKKPIPSDGFQNPYFGIKSLQCTDTKSPDAIDSQVGTLDCGTISFTYDFGRFSNPGPLTPKEEFRRTFDTYHHTKFFEDRMIDPKVYKIFLDSVDVIDVRRKSADDKLMFPCAPCNTTAEVTFKGDTYYYPLTLNEKQLDMEDFTCTFEERGSLVYKYFQKDNDYPGLYITPKQNRFKTKNTLSLRVSNTSLTTEEINNIFKQVYLLK